MFVDCSCLLKFVVGSFKSALKIIYCEIMISNIVQVCHSLLRFLEFVVSKIAF